jgi:hypothetical protein
MPTEALDVMWDAKLVNEFSPSREGLRGSGCMRTAGRPVVGGRICSRGADAPRGVDMLDDWMLPSSARALLDDVALGLTVVETAHTSWKGLETVKTPRKVISLDLGAPGTAQTLALVLRHEPIDLRRAA